MAAKGYCTVDEVANFLGRVLTPAQETHCARLIETVEADIDDYTGRAWLVGAQTDEAQYWPAFRLGNLYVRYAPVATVTIVKARAGLGSDEETLTAGEDYEAADLSAGLIYLVAPSAYDRVRVTYTPTATVPLGIQQAAAEWAASRLLSHLRPDSYGLDSLALPDLTVRFARSHVQEAMPPGVMARLDLWRYPGHA